MQTQQNIPASGTCHGLDIQKIRSNFPIFSVVTDGKPLVYFDSAATNHKPQVVIDTLSRLYAKEYGKPQENHNYSLLMTERLENTRSLTAQFISAKSSQEIVFTSGSTQGINIIANGFARAILKQGDEILISALEHHSNIVPWQLACQQTGAKLVVASITLSGELDMEEFEKLINNKTKIVSISHSSNVLGTILPVKQIVKMAHAKGIPVLIDGAQTAPHMPVNMQDMDCDFFVFSAHKMGGPAGVGILYGKQEWLDKLPPMLGGEGMADRVSFEESVYSPLPKKFEAGTPAFEEIVAYGALLDYLNELDMVKSAAYEQQLMEYGTQQLNGIAGLKIFGTSSEKEPVISFDLLGNDVKELEKYLNDNHNIAVRAGQLSAQPLMKHLGLGALLRISFCYFNTYEEIDLLVKGIQAFIAKK